MNQNQTESKPTDAEQPADEGLDETACSLSSECVLKRDLKGRLGILSAPPIFLCARESIEDLITRHNELLRELEEARQATRQWIEAWDRYGDGASLMHPRLTMAITAARKSLPDEHVIIAPHGKLPKTTCRAEAAENERYGQGFPAGPVGR